MVNEEYSYILRESVDCPVPRCGYSGTLVEVHSHLHGKAEEIHKKVAERFPNAYYPPKNGGFESQVQRAKAKEYANELDWRL